MAIAYGHYVGGFIAQFSINDLTLPHNQLDHYGHFFFDLSVLSGGIGLILLATYPMRLVMRTLLTSRSYSR